MELKKHNRYDYSPITERADYDWPEGKRLAVYFGLSTMLARRFWSDSAFRILILAAAFGLFVLLAGVTAPIWYRGPE